MSLSKFSVPDCGYYPTTQVSTYFPHTLTHEAGLSHGANFSKDISLPNDHVIAPPSAMYNAAFLDEDRFINFGMCDDEDHMEAELNLRAQILMDPQRAARLFRGLEFDLMYHDLQPCVILQREVGPLVMMRPISSVFGNRRFICNIDSRIYRFLRRFCSEKDMFFVNRVYRPAVAQFLDIFPVSLPTGFMDKLSDMLETTLKTAGTAFTQLADFHSIVVSVLSVIECCLHPSIISLTLVITALLRSFNVGASVISDAIAGLKPYLTTTLSPRPVAEYIDVKVERSMLVVLIGLVATIATGKFPAQRLLDSGLSRLNLAGRALSGANVVADMFSSQLDGVIDYVYETVYGVPRAVSDLEKFLVGIETYISDVKVFNTLDVCSRVTYDPATIETMKSLYKRGNDYIAELLRMKVSSATLTSFMSFFKVVRNAQASWRDAGGDGLSPRAEPPFILFQGAPGVGKSNMSFNFFRDMLALDKIELNSESYNRLVYTRSGEQKHWDGYNNQFICLYDDMLQRKDTVAVPNVELMEVISSQNAIPHPLNMAAVELKATTRFQSRLIVGTTNSLEYDINSLSEPEAFHRRILCTWNVTIRPQYADVNGRIDSRKVKDILGKDFSTEVYVFRRMYRVYQQGSGEFAYVPETTSSLTGPVEVQLSYDQMLDITTAEYQAFNARAIGRIVTFNAPREEITTPIPLGVTVVAPYARTKTTYQRQTRKARGQATLSEKQQSLVAWWRRGEKPEEWFDFDMSSDIDDLLNSQVSDFDDAMAFCSHFESHDFKVVQRAEVSELVERYCENPSLWYTHEKKEGFAARFSVCVRDIRREVLETFRKAKDVFTKSNLACFSILAGFLSVALWWFKNPQPDGRMISDDEFAKVASAEITSGDSITVQRQKAKFEISSGDSITASRQKARFEVSPDPPNEPSQVVESTESSHAESQSLRDSNAYEVMSSSIWPNMYKIFSCDCDGEVVKKLSNAVFVTGRCVMMNRHAYDLMMIYPRIRLVRQGMAKTLQAWTKDLHNISMILDREQLETDLVLVSLPRSIPAHKDIVSHFINRRDQGDFQRSPASLVGVRNANGENVNLWELSLIQAVARDSEEFDITDNTGLTKPINIRRNYQYAGNTINGDCGSLLVLQNPKQPKKIIGVHCAAFPNAAGISVAVCVEDLQKALTVFPAQAQCSPQFVVGTSKEVNVDDPSLPSGEFIPIGKNSTRVSGATKTKILPSPIHGKVTSVKTAPARLKPFSKDGREIDPLLAGLGKCGAPPTLINTDLVEAAACNYKSALYSGTELKYKTVFDLDIAIQGIPGDDNVPPLKRSTSAGFGWTDLAKGKPGKTRWLGNDEYNLSHPALVKSVNHRIAEAKAGRRVPTYWTDTLKDERRPFEKVALGKTRVFSCGQMDYLIVMRKYFLGFNAHVMSNRIKNEIAVGSNVYSADWISIKNHIQQKGKRVIAGDFSSFDGTLNPQILWSILDLINDWYDDGAENRLVRSILWEDIVNSVHIHHDFVYQWTHSQPSGNPMTAVLNSMYNSLSMRIVWQLVMKDTEFASLVNFTKYVNMIAYGDDNIVNIANLVIQYFNQNTITRGYALIGMTYTDENKNIDTEPSRTIDEISFLKRKFVNSYGRIVAPLALDTILEMISWVRGADDVDTSCSVIVDAALRELSLHSPDVFNLWAPQIMRACLDAGLEPPVLSSHRDMQLSVLV